jgi:DNA polymerase I-like protein with 3'-5' exonuclease and polymerase domains
MTFTATNFEAYQLLHKGILAFARAEQAGMRVDTEYCEHKQAQLAKKIQFLERDFKESNFYKHWHHVHGAKTNIDSSWQLANILYDVRKIEPTKTTAHGKGSTDEEALHQLNIPEIQPLLDIRSLKKLKNTYLEAFVREQVNNFIHPFFNLHIPKTFRSSSDRPNFQNLPRRDEQAMNIIRRALFARKGHQIGEVDYSGIEVKISTCYHKDPVMLKYMRDPVSDMHKDMAIEIFLLDKLDKKNPDHYVLRQAAKNGFVFPQFYGDYYVNCAQNLTGRWCKLPKGRWNDRHGIPFEGTTIAAHLISKGIKSYEKFEEHIKQVERNFWSRRFKVYQQWKDDWWEDYQDNGYFDLLTGFRCSGVMKKNDATNYPIQGSAFHCLLWSFIELDRIQREEKWGSRLIGQIHDAIVLDIEPSEMEHVMKTVKRVTCVDLPRKWPWIIVPLDVEAEVCEVDRPWNKKCAYKIAA